jgi:hypothetical protein
MSRPPPRHWRHSKFWKSQRPTSDLKSALEKSSSYRGERYRESLPTIKAKIRQKDDDVVSLDFTDDGIAALEEENAAMEWDKPGLYLETLEYNMDSEMADLAGL